MKLLVTVTSAILAVLVMAGCSANPDGSAPVNHEAEMTTALTAEVSDTDFEVVIDKEPEVGVVKVQANFSTSAQINSYNYQIMHDVLCLTSPVGVDEVELESFVDERPVKSDELIPSLEASRVVELQYETRGSSVAFKFERDEKSDNRVC